MIAFLGTWDFIRPVLVLFGTVLCLTSDIVTSLSSKDLTTLVSSSLQAKRPRGSSVRIQVSGSFSRMACRAKRC